MYIICVNLKKDLKLTYGIILLKIFILLYRNLFFTNKTIIYSF